MIEIKKTDDKSVYEEFGFSENAIVMSAKEANEIFGAGAVEIKDGYAILSDIKMKDEYKMFNMEFGMAKSLLNMLDLSGVKYVVSDMEDERLLTALRFKKDVPEGLKTDKEYKRYLSLDGYFTEHSC